MFPAAIGDFRLRPVFIACSEAPGVALVHFAVGRLG